MLCRNERGGREEERVREGGRRRKIRGREAERVVLLSITNCKMPLM